MMINMQLSENTTHVIIIVILVITIIVIIFTISNNFNGDRLSEQTGYD